MKKIVLLAITLMVSFTMMNAQQANNSGKANPQTRAKMDVAKINQAVELKGDEFGKVNNALIDYYTKVDALGATPDAGKVKELDKQLDAALQGALTPEQYRRWNTVKGK